jgi:hypothetical protein
LLQRLVGSVKQSLIDKTVDAGKAAYVAGVRSALVIGVVVLVAGAIGVALLLRRAPREVRT